MRPTTEFIRFLTIEIKNAKVLIKLVELPIK